ncbi:MAG: hypothetical protein HYU67_12250 [Flavobacteriia bacterium]|nr:hypothetical protein [Flavobacteriia bacterium]
MLKKRLNIKFNVIVLLLIYLFSNSPNVLFHHHEVEHSFFQHADSCEKAIYFADSENYCKHKTHISETNEECSMCDTHTFSPHSNQLFYGNYLINDLNKIFTEFSSPYFPLTPSSLSNRGPPKVSSNIV